MIHTMKRQAEVIGSCNRVIEMRNTVELYRRRRGRAETRMPLVRARPRCRDHFARSRSRAGGHGARRQKLSILQCTDDTARLRCILPLCLPYSASPTFTRSTDLARLEVQAATGDRIFHPLVVILGVIAPVRHLGKRCARRSRRTRRIFRRALRGRTSALASRLGLLFWMRNSNRCGRLCRLPSLAAARSRCQTSVRNRLGR